MRSSWGWIATSWLGSLWVLTLFIALFLVVIAPIRLGISFEQKEATQAWILVSVGGLLKARYRLPTRLLGEKSSSQSNAGTDPPSERQDRGSSVADPGWADSLMLRTARWVRLARRVYSIARPLFRRIEQLEWRTELGTGDAAATSVLVGGLWALKSTVVSVLSRSHVFVHAPQLLVAPDYNKTRFSLEFRCIFRFTIGDIIVAALKSFARPKRG